MTLKSMEKKMSSNNSDGSSSKNSNPNLKQIKVDSNKSSFSQNLNQSLGKHVRKFSDSNMMRRSVEKRCSSINKIKQNEKIKENEKTKFIDVDSLIKIEFVKSFSVINKILFIIYCLKGSKL